MNIRTKEQTAFRFDVELIGMMKRRSKALGKSMNAYVTDLIMRDIKDSYYLPKIKLPDTCSENVELFAEKLMALMSNDELRAEMGRKAYESSKRFTIDKIVGEWEKLIDELK